METSPIPFPHEVRFYKPSEPEVHPSSADFAPSAPAPEKRIFFPFFFSRVVLRYHRLGGTWGDAFTFALHASRGLKQAHWFLMGLTWLTGMMIPLAALAVFSFLFMDLSLQSRLILLGLSFLAELVLVTFHFIWIRQREEYQSIRWRTAFCVREARLAEIFEQN